MQHGFLPRCPELRSLRLTRCALECIIEISNTVQGVPGGSGVVELDLTSNPDLELPDRRRLVAPAHPWLVNPDRPAYDQGVATRLHFPSVKKLRLGGCGLRDVSSLELMFPNLESLELGESENLDVETLPTHGLRELDLTNCGLQNTAPIWTRVDPAKLEVLRLGMNYLLELDSLPVFPRLRKLYLSSGVKVVPDPSVKVSQFPALRALSIGMEWKSCAKLRRGGHRLEIDFEATL